MIRRLWPVLLVAAACAEEVPGVAPPEREVYFPIGIEVVQTANTDPVLVVSSSNFDQRYNAGYVSTYSVDDLITLARGDGSGSSVVFVDSLETASPDPFLSRVRVHQFGGDLAVLDSTSPRRVFVASRGRNVVTMMDLADDGTLDCSGADAELTLALDCSAGYQLRTFADDPYALAVAPDLTGTTPGVLVVGHLVGDAGSTRGLSVFRRIEISALVDRVAAEERGEDLVEPYDPQRDASDDEDFEATLQANFKSRTLVDVGGNAGLAYSPSATAPRFLAAAAQVFNVAGSLTLQALTYDTLSASGQPRIALETQAVAVQTRGIRITEDRAYLSVRFTDGQSQEVYNGGVAIAAIDNGRLDLLSVFEVGEEPARPTLLVDGTTRLLYVPDIRLDRIFVLDVSTDTPQLVSVILGLTHRVLEGVTTQVRMLASPTQIAIANTTQGRYGFVSNFANSTIAVLDLNDPDPRNHHVIARLGRNIDAEGDMEAPE